MKRRTFLKLSCLTVVSLAINPVSTIESAQEIGLKRTVGRTYEKAMRLALEQHAIEMERAFLYGVSRAPGTKTQMIGIIRQFKN